MYKIIIAMTMIFVALLLSGCRGMNVSVNMGERITEEETITLEGTTLIQIDTASTNIEVIQEDRSDVSVVLTTYEKGPRLTVEEGKTITIKAKQKGTINLSFSFKKAPLLKIYVPIAYSQNLEIKSASGNLTMKDLNIADLAVDLSSGNVNGKQLDFQIGTFESSSGNINLGDVICITLDLDVSSGNVDLKNFVGEIEGKSRSGNVNISYKEFVNDLDYNTSSGNITVDFSKVDIDAELDLDCSSGNVDVNFDLDETQKEKRDIVLGSMGEGTYKITLHCSSGNIKLNR